MKPTNSQHTHARAVDVNMAGMSSAQRKRLLKAVFDAGFSSIGFYKGSSNMLHIDTRSAGRTWGTQPSWARDIMRDRFTGGMKPFGGR